MNDMNLKPCPFCGGEAVPVYSNKGSLYTSNILMLSERGTVKCKKCEVRLPRIYSRVSKAIEVWNKRAEPSRLQGHWIRHHEITDGNDIIKGYMCNQCKRVVEVHSWETLNEKYPFCHCGADMQRGEV